MFDSNTTTYCVPKSNCSLTHIRHKIQQGSYNLQAKPNETLTAQIPPRHCWSWHLILEGWSLAAHPYNEQVPFKQKRVQTSYRWLLVFLVLFLRPVIRLLNLSLGISTADRSGNLKPERGLASFGWFNFNVMEKGWQGILRQVHVSSVQCVQLTGKQSARLPATCILLLLRREIWFIYFWNEEKKLVIFIN